MGVAAVKLDCGACGPVEVEASSVDVHINASDGFRLLTVACPACQELLASCGAHRIAVALAGGARRWELTSPRPALTTDDLLDLHLLLDDDEWCRRLMSEPG